MSQSSRVGADATVSHMVEGQTEASRRRSRHWREARIWITGLLLAAGVGALGDMVFLETPPAFMWGSDGDDARWFSYTMYYGVIVAVILASALTLRRLLRRKEPLSPIKRLADIGRPGVVVLGASQFEERLRSGFDVKIPQQRTADATGTEPGEPYAWTDVWNNGFADWQQEQAKSESVDELSQRLDYLCEQVHGTNISPQMELLRDALQAGHLRYVIFGTSLDTTADGTRRDDTISKSSHVQLTEVFGEFLLGALEAAGIEWRSVQVNMFQFTDCYERLLGAVDEAERHIASHRAVEREVVIDTTGGTGQYSVAAALVSMQESHTFVYKEQNGPRLIYDMVPSKPQGLFSPTDNLD